MRNFSVQQTIVSIAALAGITTLGFTSTVSSDALIAVYSLVLGGALGYVNGKKAGVQ